jgi:omega-6 fatty acid desaturase (delta-12 desaturase)
MSTVTLTQRAAAKQSSAAAPAPAVTKVAQGGQVVRRVPSARPPFTVGDIRRAIPAHCFSRPLTKSFGYVAVDLALVALLFYASTFIDVLAPDARFGAVWGPILRHVMWTAYWICQGCVGTGVWVIGHECGHRGFADSELINDIVGCILHSSLLVPYFAWQMSHKRHHSNTGSVEHDEVFVPALATEEQRAAQAAKDAAVKAKVAASGVTHVHHHDEEGFVAQTVSTLQRLFWMTVMFTAGWPAYLIYNVTSNKSYNPQTWVNHFTPSSPIFTTGCENDAWNQKLIILGDLALVAVMCVLYKCVQATSLMYVVYVYVIPYLIVNAFLVLITYLQHTDLNLPHYTDGEWDWLRGALATVDRDYGILNIVMHHITDTHVVHHLFSTMPHYHAEEATRAVKPLLGEYYRYDNTPVHKALWNVYRDCDVVYPCEKQAGVHWFEPK